MVRAGVKNLLLHKARSFLTMLGIIFGVASVIAMLAVGEGASMEQQEAIRRLGSSNIIIETVKPINEDQTTSSQSSTTQLNYGITYRDAFRMQEALPY
ncbi:MAG: ABC transporter ATP-binding protein, partial [Lentisphaerae bacterium]